MARSPLFIHLRSRTPYSMLEGAMKIGDLAKKARSFRMPALAMTDTNNLCAGLEFSEKVIGEGVQPIIGLTLSIDLGLSSQPGERRRDPDGTLVLLAMDRPGYENLMALSSSAFLDVQPTDLPHVPLDGVLARNAGLICLSGGPDGVLNRLIVDERKDVAGEVAGRLHAAFGDRLYIELQRHETVAEATTEPVLLDMAYERGIRIVATNEPYFLEPEMYEAHDALLAMSESSYILEKDRRRVTPAHYFKSPEQMVELFADLPEATEATIEIAKRCAFRVRKHDPILPDFGDGADEFEILAQQARDGLAERLAVIELADTKAAYERRLEFELDVIKGMGFPGYFLIVSDFIKYAKAQGIPVGPGRGSGAGSVVAWALTITNLDPLRYGLLFERFLNPERVSMPDFDIDFCQERRQEVIDYVRDKYGHDQVAMIITFGTLQPRAVVRDVGRVMQMPHGQVDRLAKLVPSNPANPINLTDGIAMESQLQEARRNDPAVRDMLNTALQLEGLYRNASTHAAGVVIGDRPLQQLVPLYRDPRSDIPATQFTMKWAEKAGLVKFDFLGLKTLTVIQRVLGYLKQRGIELDLETLDTTDKTAYAPLADALSAGIFQLESSGMRDVLRQMAPDSIEELTALISLYRPGPMRNIPDFIARKFERQPITYPHPSLKDILEETYGIIIYQEQVMQIAQVLSGYSLGEADILRRAMGKKDKAEMAAQKSRFVSGAVENGVDERNASEIFELVNEFAGYGFNKSHACAYAMISFQTAYLKSHYPVEFMAGIMSLDISNVDKLVQFYQEAKRMGVEVAPPCVNTAEADFSVRGGKVVYALGALKNVGVDAMRHVVTERETNGPYIDLFDFARRVDTRIVNKRAFENLARSGAFDCLNVDRDQAHAAAGTLQSIGARVMEEKASAQVSLFGDVPEIMPEMDLPTDYARWSDLDRLDEELGAVGFYLSGHPLDDIWKRLNPTTQLAADVEGAMTTGSKIARMAGVVRKRQERMSKRGKRFAFLMLSDPSGDYEVMVGEELLGPKRDIMGTGDIVDLVVEATMREGELRYFAKSVEAVNPDASPTISGLRIRLRQSTPDALDSFQKSLEGLKAVKTKTVGYIEVLTPIGGSREAVFKLPDRFPVSPDARKAIKSNPAVEVIEEIVAR